MVGAAGEAIWVRGANALSHPEWCEDPRFATNRQRMANRDALDAEINGADDEIDRAPVDDYEQMFADPYRHMAASRTVSMWLELILGAVDVTEPLQRIGAQGETEARPVRRMHHAIRTDVERLVEELPHHRHPALAYLENVAIGGCHRDVNAGGNQHPAAPGMGGQTHTVRRGQCCDAPDLGHTTGAGDVGLRDIERTALEQILEVEPRELTLPRGDRDRRRSAHLRLTGVIVG